MNLDDAQALAELWMEHHKLSDWRFRFDGAVRRFGSCNHLLKTISLSRSLVALNDEREVEETILHEIAHALTGPAHGHDGRWRSTAIAIGSKGKRCYDTNVVAQPIPKYQLNCRNCGWASRCHRRSSRTVACNHCCEKYNNGRWDSRFLLQMTQPDQSPLEARD